MSKTEPADKDTPSRREPTPPTSPKVDAETRLLRALIGVVDLDRLLDTFVDELKLATRFDGFMINLVDSDGEHLVCRRLHLPSAYRNVTSALLNVPFPIDGDDLSAGCFRARRTLEVDAETIGDYPEASQQRLEMLGVSSIAAVPILGAPDCLGTVVVFQQNGTINAETVNDLTTVIGYLGRQLPAALQSAEITRRGEALRHAEADQQDFLRFVARINDLRSTTQIHEAISTEFIRRFPFDLVGIALREGEELVVRKLTLGNPRFEERFPGVESFYLNTRFRLDIADGGLPAVFLQDTPLLFPDLQAVGNVPLTDKDRQALERMRTARTLFMVPIHRKSEPVGVLWLASLGDVVALSESDQQLIVLLADFVGTAIGNAQLYELAGKQNRAIEELNQQLREQVSSLAVAATTDRLTGLHNFAFFEQEFERRIAEHRRDPDNPLSLVIFDVDHFKRFNDRFGHLVGNRALQEIARRVRSVSRDANLPCRYGGEEFVVILPHCNAEGAKRFAERVREEVAQTPFFVGSAEGGYEPVTVSAGCATCAGGETAAQILDRADQALYRAKQAGRNRVEWSDSEKTN